MQYAQILLKLISQILIDQQDHVFAGHWRRPKNTKPAANPLRTVTIIAFIRLNCARRFCADSFGVQRRRDISCPKQRFFISFSYLVSADYQIHLFMTVKQRGNAVAIAVYINNLAGFASAFTEEI